MSQLGCKCIQKFFFFSSFIYMNETKAGYLITGGEIVSFECLVNAQFRGQVRVIKVCLKSLFGTAIEYIERHHVLENVKKRGAFFLDALRDAAAATPYLVNPRGTGLMLGVRCKVPNATFLLAQTWDPAVLRAWNVRGLRADPDLARSLYAKAAGQVPSQAPSQVPSDEQRLTATDR